jgi:hypothetical protein
VVYWLIQTAHVQEVMNSNPSTVYWTGVSTASYYVMNKMEIKVDKWGTPKKIVYKIIE